MHVTLHLPHLDPAPPRLYTNSLGLGLALNALAFLGHAALTAYLLTHPYRPRRPPFSLFPVAPPPPSPQSTNALHRLLRRVYVYAKYIDALGRLPRWAAGLYALAVMAAEEGAVRCGARPALAVAAGALWVLPEWERGELERQGERVVRTGTCGVRKEMAEAPDEDAENWSNVEQVPGGRLDFPNA